MEDFGQLLESFEQQYQGSDGEVLKGTVLKIDGPDVVVDVGQKSEGLVRLREFLDADGVPQVHPGDVI
ncbi:MAG: 30S ribosomal protein S1, partial [Terriglobales bacterium]